MKHHARASFAGTTRAAGSSRGPFPSDRPLVARILPIAVIALAAGCFLAIGVGSASAAAPKPTVTFEGVDPGYTSAHVKFTLGTSAYTLLYDVQYTTNLSSDVEGSEWRDGGGGDYGGGEQTWPFEKVLNGSSSYAVNEIIPHINPGTKYQYRVYVLVYGETEYEGEYLYPETPEPGPFFETKSVAKPAVNFNSISGITLDSAQLEGTVNTSYPGGLDAEGEAAYETEWKYVCEPECPDLPGTVVEAGEPTQPASVEAVRLEANTYYEVSLEATNAAGTTTVTKSFQTPLVAPTVKAVAGGSAGAGSFNIGGIIQPFNSKISPCHFEYGPTTEYVYSAPCSPDPIGRTEVQKITASGVEGQFKLIFRGQSTENIGIQAPAAVVESELQALSVIGPAGITEVEREIGFFNTSYTIHFSGPLASQNVGPIHGIEGTHPLCVEPNYCHLGDPGDAQTIIEGGNNAPVLVEAHLTGLTPGATYHYDLFATNSVGTVSTGDQTFIAPSANEEAECPNQKQRAENGSTGLPECRAYELVTSAPKNGFPASLTTSSENEGVAYVSKAGNIEKSGQGSAFFNYYVAKRTDQGWKTIPNLSGPQGSIYAPRGKVETINLGQFSPDLSESIWTMVVEGKPEAPYLRGPEGKYTQIAEGPGNTGALSGLFIAASKNMRHIYYYGMAYTFFPPAWGPGIGPGLYEFEGTENVGPPRRIDLLDSGEPISNCFAGNFIEGASTFDAANEDGSTVIFTEKGCEGHPAQVWARINNSKSYFASESQCTRTAADPGGACYEPWDGTYNGGATFQSAATDGSRVLFTTQQQLLNEDTNEHSDIYEYVLPTASEPNPSPNLIDVTNSSPDAQVQQVLRTSDDGKTTYFIARGVLASNRSALDEPPRAGDENLYVWHLDASHPDGETKFIGRLTAQPDFIEQFGVEEWPFVKKESEVTPDGRYFAFKALTPLTPNDTDNAADVFRYDDSTGELTRVSTGVSGTGGNGDDLNVGFTQAKEEHTHPAMTSDGQEIVFTTSEALSPNDGNGAPDIYIWKNGHTALISTGAVGGGAEAAVIDGSGTNIYFGSTQKLTQDDTDSVKDVYDARIDGGFSFAHVENCTGEACQPEQQAVQEPLAPATDRANGSGNHQRASVSVAPLGSAERKKLASGGRAAVSVTVSGAGQISLEGSASANKRPIQAFTATRRSVQAGPVSVPVTLSKDALAQLRKTGTLKIQLAVEFADAEPARAAVTLKAPSSGARRARKHGH